MPVTAIVGAQWGDEGKGRIVDYLAQHADLVLRFQGGDNAGHTVVNDLGTFKLHLVPSGIFRERTLCVVGAGCAVNLDALLTELSEVEAAGVNVSQLVIARRATLVLPMLHPKLDELYEKMRSVERRIGTTKKGIGPTYTDDVARRGLRVEHLLHLDVFEQRVLALLERYNPLFIEHGKDPVELADVMAAAERWLDQLGDRIVDTIPLLQRAVDNELRIMLEGQLGVMRDLRWGIYPFVTSSHTMAAGGLVGSGLPANTVIETIGVVKTYSTAVGTGFSPVELHDEFGEKLRDIGHEYGATTGRPRRCGWFDGVAIRYAAWLNGFSGLAMTKLDVLDTFETLKICVAYEIDGVCTTEMPDAIDLERAIPIYEEWEGWMIPTKHCRSWDDLPENAKAYLLRLSELAGTPISFVSVGPKRPQMFPVTPEELFEGDAAAK